LSVVWALNALTELRSNTPAPQDARPFPTAVGKATGGAGATAAK